MTEELSLQIFKEVPDYDPRTLVLQRGTELLDLQFCSCPNKYKKRFSTLIEEHPELVEFTTKFSIELAEQGYSQYDIKDVLDFARGAARGATPASEYFAKYPHDFNLEVLYRNYLVRKLLMTEPRLFGFFALSPIKCRANCGYPEAAQPKEEEAASLAGF